MPSGRKSTKTKAPTIVAPPQITRYEMTSPLGDRYINSRENNTEFTNTILSPQTRSTVQTGQDALVNLANELNTPDARRVQQIAQRAQDFYDLQSSVINSEADNQFSKAQSDLSKRFGGAYNATFGTDFLSRIEGNRLAQLSDAGKQAALLGEDLYQQDEDARIRRFSLFSDYLNNEYNKALGAYSVGSQVLQDETNRAQDLAVARANLLQKYLNSSQAQSAKDEAQQRSDLVQTAATTAAAILPLLL